MDIVREIKFRVWDKDLKCMHNCEDVHDSITFDDNGTAHYYNLQNGCGSPETYELMQFTGLHDKNGKEIYESDVVEVTREGILERGVVIFGSGCYFIKVKEHFLNSVTLLPLHECSRNDYKLKVIGNIYENSDLLGE